MEIFLLIIIAVILTVQVEDLLNIFWMEIQNKKKK